jgi:hypothetical protein
VPVLPPQLDGPIRRCGYCDHLTPTGYENLAYRCPVCGHATTPIPADVLAAILDEMLGRMSGGEVSPLRDLARASVLQLWEATARERGDATLWPKPKRGPAVTPAPGRALAPPPKLLPRLAGLPLEERFWSRVDKSGDCWLWMAGTAQGRPWFEATRAEGGRKGFAYRWAWGFMHGPIPDGMQLMNDCGTRLCVRPDHHYLARPRPPIPGSGLPLAERFWNNVDKSGECWIWTAGTDRGRGWFEVTRAEGSKKGFAYRWAWEFTRGPLPPSKCLWNTCGNRLCVNPNHYQLR